MTCLALAPSYEGDAPMATRGDMEQLRGNPGALPGAFKEVSALADLGLSGDFLLDLIHNGGLDGLGQDEELDDGDEDTAHGFYNTVSAYTNAFVWYGTGKLLGISHFLGQILLGR